MPMVDLPDLLPFFRYSLALNNRRLTEDDGQLTFITPDTWRTKDFALTPRYENLVFDRKLKGRDAAQRVLGAGHRVFDAALRDAIATEAQVACLPGVEQPLCLFEVWDRITGPGSPGTHVVVGVVTDEVGSMKFLRDWEVIRQINDLRVGQRGANPRADCTEPGHLVEIADRAENNLRVRLDDLRLGFKLADVRLVGALIPTSQDHSAQDRKDR
jgi:hypothetical protein